MAIPHIIKFDLKTWELESNTHTLYSYKLLKGNYLHYCLIRNSKDTLLHNTVECSTAKWAFIKPKNDQSILNIVMNNELIIPSNKIPKDL